MPHVAAWYRRETYKRVRKIMDDGDKLPRTFDEWEKTAKGQLTDAAANGITIKPVILDPEEFLAFCKRENHAKRGSRERALFAISRCTVDGLTSNLAAALRTLRPPARAARIRSASLSS